MQDCIRQYGDLIWSLARRYLRHDADAEDAVQEIFIELWNSAARFDRKVATEVAFVATIARRRLIDRVRQKGRRPAMASLDDGEDGEKSPYEPAVLPHMEQDADAAVVARALETMAPEQRTILSMSLYEGYTHTEIAERLEIPLGTVKTRVRRGLIHLRELLGIRVSGEDGS